jgi:biotin carboxylase
VKRKKILILAGADVHNKLVRAANEMGIYTIVSDYLSLENSPAKQLADEYWSIDIKDIEELTQKCIESKVDAVIAFCIDPAQIPYRQLCSRLNLPCYGTCNQFEIFTNKAKFKEYCKLNSVGVIPDYTYEDYIDGSIEYPILIKPNISRGSRGQSICYSSESVESAIQKAKEESLDNNIIIEKYMGNSHDMEFSWIVIDSEPYLMEIADRTLGYKSDNLDRQLMMLVIPSWNIDEYYKNVHRNIKAMIQNAGIKFGAVFMQGFWENGKVYMYDPGLRLPGGDFEDVLSKYIGFDAAKTFVNFALTGDIRSCFGDPQDVAYLNGGIAICLAIACRPGQICDIRGLEEISSHPNVVTTSMRYKKGDIVPESGDVRQRVAEFMCYFPNRKEASSFVEYVYANLSYTDEDGKEMIVSRVNPQSILSSPPSCV